MFDKFGEFDSFSEINELAENLLNDKDYKRTVMDTGSTYHPNERQILQSVCMAGVKQCAVRAHIQQHNA